MLTEVTIPLELANRTRSAGWYVLVAVRLLDAALARLETADLEATGRVTLDLVVRLLVAILVLEILLKLSFMMEFL